MFKCIPRDAWTASKEGSVKLRSFGSRYALAFALGIAGAVAACGGDDSGPVTGAGGSGGVNPDAARGGAGVSEAGPDRGPDRAAGGSAGTGGTGPDSSAAGSGGAGPDAAEAAPGTGG